MSSTWLRLVGVTTSTLIAACATSAAERAWPEPRDLGAELEAYRPPRDPPGEDAPTPTAPRPTGALEHDQAIGLALAHSPALRRAGWSVRGAEARAEQAGLWPNPELELELENFGGQRALGGVDGAEAQLRLSQKIETWGKRGKREARELREAEILGWDYEAKRLQVVAETSARFYQVLAAQERVELAAETLSLAEQVAAAVTERVAAGKVAPLEQSRAEVAVESARLANARTELQLAAARQQLASSWGSLTPSFESLRGELTAPRAPPRLEALSAMLAESPELARWGAVTTAQQAGLELAVAEAVPDLGLSAGVKRVQEADDTAFVVGLALPVPLFDRNQGRIDEQRFALASARDARHEAEARLQRELVEAHRDLTAAYLRAEALRGQILPAAERAYAAAREGFDAGKFAFLDVLDAQRTLFEVKGEYVDALADSREAGATIERITGRPLPGDTVARGNGRTER